MIPELTDYGLLPPGIYPTTEQEIVDRYCGNPNRMEIWTLFREFLGTELPVLTWSRTMLIDGGFTSDKPVTKDVDVVLDVSPLADADLLEAIIWQTQNHGRVKARYKTDFWIYHPRLPQDLGQFFCYVREAERLERGAPVGTTKGLLRLEL